MNSPAYLVVGQQVGLADGLAVGFLFEGFAVGNFVGIGVGGVDRVGRALGLGLSVGRPDGRTDGIVDGLREGLLDGVRDDGRYDGAEVGV